MTPSNVSEVLQVYQCLNYLLQLGIHTPESCMKEQRVLITDKKVIELKIKIRYID